MTSWFSSFYDYTYSCAADLHSYVKDLRRPDCTLIASLERFNAVPKKISSSTSAKCKSIRSKSLPPSPLQRQDISPSEVLLLGDERVNKIVYRVLEELHNNVRVTTDHLTDHLKEYSFQSMYGARSKKEGPFPFANLHEHTEGAIPPWELEKLVKKYSLYYDEAKKAWRRKKTPTKNGLKSDNTPARLTWQEIEERYSMPLRTFLHQLCCVPVNQPLSEKLSFKFKEDFFSRKFDETFGPIGSILDRIPLSEQLLIILYQAELSNIIYNELMFGLYVVPVPSTFIEEVELQIKADEYEHIEEMPIDKIEHFIEYLINPKHTLDALLTDSEKNKFKRKLQGRCRDKVGQDPQKKMENLEEEWKSLLNMTYVEAFKKVMTDELDQAELDINQQINILLKKQNVKLRPNVFDARNPITIKLIFEVMRHYSLGEFFAWALAASAYIATDEKERIVGLTVDGPQNTANSINNFYDQIAIIKTLRKHYPAVKVTYHTLEFASSHYDSIHKYVKDELSSVLKVSERIGHGTMIADTTNLIKNLKLLKRNKLVEICLTTVQATTGVKIEEVPLKALLEQGIAVNLNTDDPAIVDTNLREELRRAIKLIGISPADTINMMRSAIHFSFLPGESIYNAVEARTKVDGRLVTKIWYDLKFPEEHGIRDLSRVSAKELKLWQLEDELQEFCRYIYHNMDPLFQLGYIKEESLADEETFIE
ncbi:hypothetical protein [Neochlamydia sp. S13]|uniref:hypothetical protein n=1 Tax=Neochlamydia sp. S13 TaxID=1353976 RepID=UPI0005A84F09|nr:hypothetical protein [Neochlamydia sp. S13]BBI16799.1 hypothetical protein NCS13_1_0604 [Neochlamydia sp. S13]